MLDLAIIGSGPAALTAAIYAARAGLDVEVFEKTRFGGALPDISHLANFPGFDGQGKDLSEKLQNQAKEAGAKLSYGTCEKLEPLLIDDEEIKAKTILIATGSEPKKLPFELKMPVSYCVLCDGSLYKDKNVAIVGGGNSAVGEAIYLTKVAKHVTVIARSTLKAEDALIDQLRQQKNLTILENTEPESNFLDSFDGVFVLIGKTPATSFVEKSLLDKNGFIETDENFMTKKPGIFAAGDVRKSSIKQAITAAAEGAAAAITITDFLKKMQ